MGAARALALAGLLGSGLVVISGGSTAATPVPSPALPGTAVANTATVADTPVPWCSPGATRPCLAGATRNGVDVRTLAAWDVQALTFAVPGDPSRNLLWSVTKDGSYDLGAAARDDTWRFVFDMGTFVPRVVTGKGRDVGTVRRRLGDGTYRLTVRATPVRVSGQCDQSVWPWVCEEWADNPDPVENQQWEGTLNGLVSDNAQWTDTAQREASYGLDHWTNIAATDVPPLVVYDAARDASMLVVNLANRHFLQDGSTVFRGRSELRIPNAFLREAYGVPNPATMTGSSLATSVSGTGAGVVDVYQEPSGTAMRVDVRNMTFSLRALRVRRGVIVPTRPTELRSKRVAVHRGRVAFTAAKPRGAKVTGYRARCRVVRGTHVVRGTSDRSPVVVRRLKKGRAYRCTVRALSRAGAGPWSKAVRLRARP